MAIQALPDLRQHDRVEIHAWEGRAGFSRGTTFERRIEVRVAPELAGMDWFGLDTLIAHELVHYYLGESWDVLPPLIEEGLADLMAQKAVSTEAAYRRLSHASVLTSAIEDGRLEDAIASFTLPRDEFRAVPHDRYRIRSALGWFFVERIGVEDLRALVERAQALRLSTVPVEWFFEAARLDPTRPEAWLPEVLKAVGLRIKFH